MLAGAGFAVWTLGLYNAWKGLYSNGADSITQIARVWVQAQDIAVGLDRTFELLEQEPEVADRPDAVALPGCTGRWRSATCRSPTAPTGRRWSACRSRPTSARSRRWSARRAPARARSWRCSCACSTPTRARSCSTVSTCARARVADLRRAVAIALQENVLFATSVRENIRYGRAGASDAEVRDAAHVACADEFIAALADGYETELGERGTRLSTGQRQRLTIARALLKDPQILLLDEPTASLDAETEQRLVQSLAEWGRGRCIFLVTHRLSTVRLASRVVFLDRGKVVEVGSPDELLARPGGAYRALVETERARGGSAGVSGSTLAVFARALRFVAPLRGRFAVKVALHDPLDRARSWCCRSRSSS